MFDFDRAISLSKSLIFASCILALFLAKYSYAQEKSPLCIDGFCVGQSIRSSQFDTTEWFTPKTNVVVERCKGIGCRPDIAFRGYPHEIQIKLSQAVSLQYDLDYTLITKETLNTLRDYKYECNLSAGGSNGERRFIGLYRSKPSGYISVVGLRLIDGDLKIYRVARQYPFHNFSELKELANKIREEYGSRVLIYNYLSSNAYSDVISQRRDGWFARSSMFNPGDLADNEAELVLIDPNTRQLLEPTSMPESGEIKPLPMRLPQACTNEVPLQ